MKVRKSAVKYMTLILLWILISEDKNVLVTIVNPQGKEAENTVARNKARMETE